jgi:hypothetical protein
MVFMMLFLFRMLIFSFFCIWRWLLPVLDFVFSDTKLSSAPNAMWKGDESGKFYICVANTWLSFEMVVSYTLESALDSFPFRDICSVQLLTENSFNWESDIENLDSQISFIHSFGFPAAICLARNELSLQVHREWVEEMRNVFGNQVKWF